MNDILSQPIYFARSGKTAPNRFLKSANTEQIHSWSNAQSQESIKPNFKDIRLYTDWGQGKIGTIVLGNIPCDRRYREAIRNAANAEIDPLWDPAEGGIGLVYLPFRHTNSAAALTPVVATCKSRGSLCIGQVTYAGRQTHEDTQSIRAGSSEAQNAAFGDMMFGMACPMTAEEMKNTVRRFTYAAKLLSDAGADGIQVHASHGYLLSELLSLQEDRRTGYYGSSFDKRAHIVFQIAEAIKERVVDQSFILSIKIDSQEFIESRITDEQLRETCLRLENAGFDLIELSGGPYENVASAPNMDSAKRREGLVMEFAGHIRPHLRSAKLAVTGGFRSVETMVQAIRYGSTDIVGFSGSDGTDPVKLFSGEDGTVQLSSDLIRWGQSNEIKETMAKKPSAASEFSAEMGHYLMRAAWE